MKKSIALLLCFIGVAAGQDFSPTPLSNSKAKKVWKVSLIVLGAATALDGASSYGRCCEANPLLASNGAFSGKGIALKAGLFAGNLAGQTFTVKRDPGKAKMLAIVNFGTAALFTTLAVRNYRLPQNAVLGH